MEQKESWLDPVDLKHLSNIGSGNALLPWCIIKDGTFGTYKGQPAIYVSKIYFTHNNDIFAKSYEYILTEYDIFEIKRPIHNAVSIHSASKYNFNYKTKEIEQNPSYAPPIDRGVIRKLPDDDKRVIFWHKYLRRLNFFNKINNKTYLMSLNDHWYDEMQAKVEEMRREIAKLQRKEKFITDAMEDFANKHNIKR